MIYEEWEYVRPGLSRPVDFGVDKNMVFYVCKSPKLEFDGRCFWNGTNERQMLHYWWTTDGEDWEGVEKNVRVGDYWIVRDYQIIEERTKESKTGTTTINTTWTTAFALGNYFTNNWQNAYVSTGRRTSDYIDGFWRQAMIVDSEPVPTASSIQRAVMEALRKEDWRDALDQLVPHYISSWEIEWPPYGVKELRCAGADGQVHIFNLDMLGI